MLLLLIYVLLINLIAFTAMGIDKSKAKKHLWRIPESTLLLLSVLGGAIGMLLGMNIFHHKTLHKKFTIGVPLILLIQIVLIFIIRIKIKMNY